MVKCLFSSCEFLQPKKNVRNLSGIVVILPCSCFEGGDQGLLNLFFSDWATKDISRHLPFVYNVVAQTFYTYGPALKQ